MELTVRVKMDGALMTREAALIAQKMKEYSARVLLRRSSITVNAKSLMGLVSLGIRDGMDVTIIAEGADDAHAVREMAALLGA